MASDKLEPPKHSKGDTAHALAKAGISAIPIIGGPGAELFQHIVQPPLEKRRIEWMGCVGEKLIELESRGVDIGQLSENEEFVSAVLLASQIAIRTHRREKREALRNALFNIASGRPPRNLYSRSSLSTSTPSRSFTYRYSSSSKHLRTRRT